MLDRQLLSLLKSPTDAAARRLLERGYTADQVTLAGFAIGLAAALLIALGYTVAAIVPLLVSRAFDGLDGAMARFSRSTDRGAFLDISLDFMFYAAVPLAFILLAPSANAIAGAWLLAAFAATGTTFLAYAAIAEKRGLKSTAYPTKSFYYVGGLTEATETIACFIAMCLWPRHFAIIAYGYAALCAVTTLTRLVAGWRTFGETER